MGFLSGRTGRFLRREPLIHFLSLAALLCFVDHILSSTQRTEIVLDRQLAAFSIQQHEDLELLELRPEERRETIDAFVEDEILYSEAYKRGLDRDDTRMRRNLVLKMRGLLVGDIGDPSEDELRAYNEARRDRFKWPATVSLEHVFYSNPKQVPEDIRGRLQSSCDLGPGATQGPKPTKSNDVMHLRC